MMKSSKIASPAPSERLYQLARAFRLPTIAEEAAKRLLSAGHSEALDVLVDIFEMEAEDRLERRIERLRREAKLPSGKTFETLEWERFPKKLQAKFKGLSQGEFAERAENVIIFGLPGVGKSHVASAIGHSLVSQGRSVLYTPTYRLIQDLLASKRDLDLPRKLRKLDNFEVLILDDIGYTQQSAEEIEVLFTLLAERYERRSVIITSNLVFSEWEQIFKNPMTTAAAIDRVVHHATILEFKVSSYRSEQARGRISETKQDKESSPTAKRPEKGTDSGDE